MTSSTLLFQSRRNVHVLYYEPDAKVMLQGFGFNEDIFRTLYKGSRHQASAFEVMVKKTSANERLTLTKHLPSRARLNNLAKGTNDISSQDHHHYQQQEAEEKIIKEEISDRQTVSIQHWKQMYQTLKERKVTRVSFLAFKNKLGPIAVSRQQARRKLRRVYRI